MPKLQNNLFPSESCAAEAKRALLEGPKGGNYAPKPKQPLLAEVFLPLLHCILHEAPPSMAVNTVGHAPLPQLIQQSTVCWRQPTRKAAAAIPMRCHSTATGIPWEPKPKSPHGMALDGSWDAIKFEEPRGGVQAWGIPSLKG